MPLTFAHPAAVIPLVRLLGRHACLSALVIGSMIPDLPYFLPFGAWGRHSHSLGGMLYFCLPLGLLVVWLFQHGLRRPLIDLLPPSLAARLGEPGRHAAPAIAVSLALGIISHVLWDAATHDDGAIVALLPSLRQALFSVGDYTVYVYKLLQHGSTALGLALIAWYVSRWWRRTAPRARVPLLTTRLRLCLYLMLVLAATGAGLADGLREAGELRGMLDLSHFLRGFVTVSTATAGGLLCIYCLWWHWWNPAASGQDRSVG